MKISETTTRAVGRVCVFCGSSPGSRPAYLAAARDLGKLLAESGIELVYGGSNIGLMKALADSTLQAGGKVIGVIPQSLVSRGLAHPRLSQMHSVSTMHQRKAMMAELSGAFIALPGGFGTLEELWEVLSWAQLGLHAKACGLLNVAGYYDPLLALADHMVAEGFLDTRGRALLLAESDPARLIEMLRQPGRHPLAFATAGG